MVIMLEIVLMVWENRDMICFNFVLNWFFYFGRVYFYFVREFENNSMFGSGKEIFVFF